MNPTEPSTHLAACSCGWSSRCDSEDDRAHRLRYHNIQVHNDLKLIDGRNF